MFKLILWLAMLISVLVSGDALAIWLFVIAHVGLLIYGLIPPTPNTMFLKMFMSIRDKMAAVEEIAQDSDFQSFSSDIDSEVKRAKVLSIVNLIFGLVPLILLFIATIIAWLSFIAQ